MAVKRLDLPGIGPVVLMKRKGAKSVRITIPHSGEVRVVLPSWAPYQVGIDFAHSKAAWIQSQAKPVQVLEHKQRVGKAHHLLFSHADGASVVTRIAGNEIRILLPAGVTPTDSEAQIAAEKAAIRALKKEAQGLLPYRLKQLAETHGFEYKSVAIKRMTGRWGSCSQHKDIVLNCYLMELPWNLIDYVIMHELVHTKIMAHGPVFWQEVGRYVPNLALIRREIKAQKPILQGITKLAS